MRKIVVLGIAALFVIGLLCGNATAKEYRIGYVDLARVSDEYAKTKEYDKSLETQIKAKDAERQKLVDEIRKLKDEQALLSDKAKAEKQTIIEDKIKNLQEFDKKFRDDLVKQRNQMYNEIQKDVEGVISVYSKEAGYDIVLIKQTILYAPGDLDMTNEVIKRLNAPKK